jgi:hypothetical protein
MGTIEIQLIGYISVIFHFLAFFEQKKQYNFLLFNLISIFLLTTHFYYLNALNAVFVMTISFFINLFSILIFKYNHKKLIINIKKTIIVLTPFLGLINFYFLNNGNYSILPSVGSIFAAIAALQTNLLKSKYILYGSVFCWGTYSFLVGSIPGVFYDIIGFSALTFSIYKIKQKTEN